MQEDATDASDFRPDNADLGARLSEQKLPKASISSTNNSS